MTVKAPGALATRRKFDLSTLTILLLTLALMLMLTLTSPTFLSGSNVFSILYGVSISFCGAIGFTCLMIMGEIDLSVGSVYAFSGMMVGMLMKRGMALIPSLAIALALCAAIGLVNGILVVRLKANSMMITLGTMTAVRGLANLLCSNLYGYPYPADYMALSKVRLGGVFLTVYLMIALALALEVLLRRHPGFRKMYYVGENIESARISGINAARVKIGVFAATSLLSGVGGILTGSRLSFADTTIGDGLEFTILTACVLGGASLAGGKGSILRSCIALIFLATITNGMIIHNIEPLIQQLIVGAILIVSVFADTQLSRPGGRALPGARRRKP